MALQHLRSSTANKRPVPGNMSDGQLGVNTNSASPGLFFKDSNANLVKVGPVHVGTTAPNASPAVGGTAGNSVGEQWLDTSSSRYVFKIWDGSAWRSEAGEFVDVAGDVMTGALGIVAGSAASPGLYVSGDTDTGLFSAGLNQLALATGGTGRLFVDASGRIGIGQSAISSPLDDLHISSAEPGFLLEETDAGIDEKRWRIRAEGSILRFEGINDAFNATTAWLNVTRTTGARTVDNIAFSTGTSERLRITSAGLVGIGASIGTWAPGATLDVRSGSNSTTVEEIAAFARPDAAVRASINKGVVSGNGISFGTTTNHPLVLRTNALERIAVGATGTTTLTSDASIAPLIVNISASEVARVTSDGYLRLSSSSPGIQFGGDTAAANALDDYEEGTFTPTVTGSSTAGTGTYNTNGQVGRYTKIGNRVSFTIYVDWSAHTGTGNLRVSGLPFTSNSAANAFNAVALYAGALTYTGPMLQAYFGAGSTTIIIGQMTAAGVASGVPMDTAANLTLTGHYEV
jgi:hypothetical protein